MTPPNTHPIFFRLIASLSILLCWTGCVPQPENAVIVYCATDREVAQPIFEAAQIKLKDSEIVVQYDVESTKTVGLVTRIESEAARTKCDLFWNNEILHTIRLENAGLLQSISWDIPSGWPTAMKSKNDNWVGIAARARVILVNRELLPETGERPHSIFDLANEKWNKQCGLALPLFGTTATHFCTLAVELGEAKSDELFRSIADNAVVFSGNKQVAQAVSSGRIAFGFTDTDDALIEIEAGMPVDIIWPDQEPGELGTLRIPNTVAVIKNAPHPIAAQQLANFLVSENVEGRLAMGVTSQFPIRPNHPQLALTKAEQVRWSDPDFYQAAKAWIETSKKLEQIFRQ